MNPFIGDNGDDLGGQEIAGQLSEIRKRIFSGGGSNDDFTAEVTDKYQIDLNDPENVAASLEDTDLMAHMNSARKRCADHLAEMQKLPTVIAMRAKHADCISRISDEIACLNSFYDEYHDKMESAFQVFTRLNKLNSRIKFRAAGNVAEDLLSITKLSMIAKDACDDTMKQIKNTQNKIFVLRRDIDMNFENMLSVTDSNVQKSNKLSQVVATMKKYIR
jgi:hypothetical protein